jgi:NADH-quinone oxidoreductase subunit H
VSLLIFFLLSCLKIAVVLAIFLGAVAYTVLLERKLVGRIQNRWGPSRVGPFGLWQPMADGLKLFLKEDLIPTGVYRPLYIMAPMIALGCALISIAVVPFGAHITWHGVDMFEIANVNIGLLVILGVTSVGVYGIALAGWSSNNKYSLLGALRASAQVISYELALGLSVIGVVLRAGSLNLRTIVDSQSAHGLLSWNVFGGFQFVAFFIYLPFGSLLPAFDGIFLQAIVPVFWFVFKVFCFLFLYIWVRGTLPRLRYDQLMGFGWKFLMPLAIANILATSLWLALRTA